MPWEVIIRRADGERRFCQSRRFRPVDRCGGTGCPECDDRGRARADAIIGQLRLPGRGRRTGRLPVRHRS
jgi:hypothetical protein